MNIKKLIIQGILLLLCITVGFITYKRYFKSQDPFLYQAETLKKRHIRQSIKATGNLEPEELLKVGSLISGIIKKMFVEENDFVKKGQLIAIIDDGREDSSVKIAEQGVQIAKVNVEYFEQFVARQKKLYENGFLSENEYQRLSSELAIKQKELIIKEEQLAQEQRLFAKKQIAAPEDGIVVGKNGSEGEMVTNFGTSFAIYTIAKDISKMLAKIEIDESSVGLIKQGMTAQLHFDAYPGKIFESTIKEISNNPIAKGGTVSYIAKLPIQNKELLFKPGMTLDADIVVREAESVPAIEGQVFAINPKTIEHVAKIKKYAYQPLSVKEKLELEKQENTKFLWIEKEQSFIERAVKIGITDGAYFEIIDGITETDQIVVDTIEANAVEAMFKKMFNTGLK